MEKDVRASMGGNTTSRMGVMVSGCVLAAWCGADEGRWIRKDVMESEEWRRRGHRGSRTKV